MEQQLTSKSEVFLAGLIMGLLEHVGSIFIGGEYRGIVSLAIFILIIVIRPQGLFKR